MILAAFCVATSLNRKYAIGLLRHPPEAKVWVARRRKVTYSEATIMVLELIWAAADLPWSVRLKAMLPLWLPWARKRVEVTPEVEAELARISARTIDRRLQHRRVAARRRLYGRTKPGTLLKHQMPVRTERWDVNEPGWGEIDLVSHSGPCAEGECAHSLNVTDIHSTWVETRAVLGKGQEGVIGALSSIQSELPFALGGLDCDNGSEVINWHVFEFCKGRAIQLSRGRPYKKDDNAHVEQKNWTHVRPLVGWERIDSKEAVVLLDDLYRNEWRWMMNFFRPSVKLIRKERIGARVRRVYDAPTTPLDRLVREGQGDPHRLAQLVALRSRLDPITLSDRIQKKIDHVHRVARRAAADPHAPASATTRPVSRRGVSRAHPLLTPPPQGGGRPHPETSYANS